MQDPLLAGRLVSVISGFGSLIAIWFVTYELFKKKKIAFFASLIYVCYPFATVADRMALYDSLAGCLTLIALYFSILLVKKVRLDLAYTVGFSIGLGVLNKSTNFFGLYLLPITIILFDFGRKKTS
jgi:4-amino-4-deoxy-L-arabinose transferase-like glycosyltransferase